MESQSNEKPCDTGCTGKRAELRERAAKMRNAKRTPRSGAVEFAGVVRDVACECRANFGEVYQCPCTVSGK